MQKISFIFYTYDAPFISLPSFFSKNVDLLKKCKIFYSPTYIDNWQYASHDNIIWDINYLTSQLAGTEDFITYGGKNISPKIKEIVDPEKEHTLFLGALQNIRTLSYFLTSIEKLTEPADSQAIFVMGRQDGELLFHMLHIWKRLSVKQICAQMIFDTDRQRLDLCHSLLADYCGAENCHFIPHETGDPYHMQPSAIQETCRLLGIPAPDEASIRHCLPTRPLSLPGLDMYSAVYDFPFSFKGKVRHDRNAFNACLRRVEEQEGYAPLNALPRPEADNLLSACAEGNARLARLLGRDALFASPHPLDALPGLPDDLPGMTDAQCRIFVSALAPELRADLLRFFRDKTSSLHPTEAVLARQLEDYRRRLMVDSPFVWPRKDAPVSVLTLCWNQEKYIEQCMESVAAQRCSLPVDHIIVDDCSDDASASIIDNFASSHARVRPIYLEQRSLHGENVRALFSHCKSHFVSLCDGDDYFTDESKLQKQVDFLAKNSHCSLCFHPVMVTYENGQPPRLYPPQNALPGGIRPYYNISVLLYGNLIQTNSVMYRWRFRDGLPDWFDPTLVPGDWYWHLLHAELGSIGYLPEIMSVYRRHEDSLYAMTETNVTEHRRYHGMEELRMYRTVNQHFGGKYYKQFCALAKDAIADFFYIYMTTGNDELFQKSMDLCPEFGLDFLKSIKINSHP